MNSLPNPLPAEPSSHAVDFWQPYYESNQLPWDLDGPAPPFVQLLQHPPDWLTAQHAAGQEKLTGQLAVLGSGRGHDAALFAKAGFDTSGFDYAPGAISQAQGRYGHLDNLRFIQADIFALPANNDKRFDVVVEHTCFCAIPIERRDDYVMAVSNILKPGGIYLGLFWAHGRPGGPPFTTNEAEIRQRFGPSAETPFTRTSFECLQLAITPDSTPSRQGQELLGVFRKTRHLG